MPFKKGQSGNPGGRPRQRKFREALSIALSETDAGSGQSKLRRIADNLVNAAVDGESWAIKEVADRTDGKSVQAVDLETATKSCAHEYTDAELFAIIDESKQTGVLNTV